MKVYTTDGLVFECGGYKAVRAGGVVLTRDKKRKHVIGYVPAAQLRYILPDDIEPETNKPTEHEEAAAESATDGHSIPTDGEADSVIDLTSEPATTTTSDGGESEAKRDDETDADADGESVVAAEVAADEIGVVSIAGDEQASSHSHEELTTELADHDGRLSDHDERLGELERRVDELSAQMTGVLEAVEAEPYDPEALTNIRGIGSAYATRLGEAGIDSITKLLEASVEDVVAATEVGERRAEEWKQRAETHHERELVTSAYAAEREVDEE
ncbi:helix-hairpin-helix domain-containing protein [Haloferax namakaokahaiae]|uniref:Helix-hairpin-helix domain-containing protein n=1 Tax=Haloferax namakaokahaiae TaxID=1748331 RepID=A0ABD5ZBD1_9EURY